MGKGRILLVDDEVEIRGFLQDYFEDRDYDTVVASDGLEGVEKFESGSFDLVLLDMMMPKLQGIDVLKRIKEAKPEQRVIMLTGVKEESMIEKAKALGCDHFMNKPVRLQELEERVNECFAN